MSLKWPSSHMAGFTLCRLVGSLLPMLRPCSTGDVQQRGHRHLTESHLLREWAQKSFRPGSLVGVLCTYHVSSLDPRCGRDLPLEHGAHPAFGLSIGKTCCRLGCGSCTGPDFVLPGWTRVLLLRPSTEGTLIPRYQR
jgi:hypothetical protein